MSGAIQFLNITPKDFLDEVDKRLDNRFVDFTKKFKPDPPEEFMTKEEVSKLLKVTKTTINNYTNRGILTPYGLGGMIYFKRSEIEKAIIKLR
ncbi:helix-turn-helix domain-containing protein [Flagellimonas sp.]|uniref:helix-turn-helix domain-containing protein n=1 Tax=Flagellimonas sp. TaxID=2058762 RepID=UPI003BB0C2AB